MRLVGTRSVQSIGAAALALAVLVTAPAGARAGFSVGSVPNPVAIPAAGPADPYPSALSVPPFGGHRVLNVVVQLQLTHAAPADLDILLVGPTGQKVLLLSDACGGGPIADAFIAFGNAGSPAPQAGVCASGSFFTPTDYGAAENLPAPAPAGPYSSSLGVFEGTDAVGQWNLYVNDDNASNGGSVKQWVVQITTPDGELVLGSGTSSVYPVPVTGTPNQATGPVSDVNVTLTGVNHTFPDDLDILLVSPSGRAVTLMSDACGPADLAGTTFVLDDEAPSTLIDGSGCAGGTFRPSDFPNTDTYPSAPPGPYPTTLSTFDGELTASGWKVYVVDDTPAFDGGWIEDISIDLTYGPPLVGLPPNAPASVYPMTKTVDLGRPVTSVRVQLNGLTHTNPNALDLLLVSPTGAKSLLMSDVCGTGDLVDLGLRFDQASPGLLPVSGATCQAGSFKPTEEDPGTDDLPGPAPAGPAAADLGVFRGTDPDGTWQLYSRSDSASGRGFLMQDWTLEIETRPGAPVAFAAASQSAAEGSAATLTLRRDDSAAPLLAGSVKVETVEGSAKAGEDFTLVSQTVAFAAGEREKTVSVPVAGGGSGEPAEEFAVRLSDPSRDAALGAQATTIVTIPADRTTAGLGAFTAANAVTLPSNRACLKRPAKLRIAPRKPAGVTITRVRALAGRKTLADRRDAKARQAFTLSRLPSKAFTLTVKVTDDRGRTVTVTRAYKVCSR